MNDMTMNGMLLSAIGTLGGIVAYLWKQLTTNYNEIKIKSIECEEDRKELWKDRAELWEELAKVNQGTK